MAPVRAAAVALLVRASARARPRHCGCRAVSTLPPAKEIAVLGAGLTGLATAHYLAARVPATTRITVYESSARVGGWIDSSPVDGKGDDTDEANVFEAGARTVAPQRRMARYDDLLLLELVAELGLADRLRVTRQRAAQYIYYPDHLVEVSAGAGSVSGGGGGGSGGGLAGLVDVARRAWQLTAKVVSEPLFRGLVPVLARLVLLPEPASRAQAQQQSMRAAGRSPGRVPADETAGAYAVRRLGPAAEGDAGRAEAEALVNNLLSAMLHGIYGGDVWRLSVASSPLRADWLDNALTPLFQRYALRMQYAALRQQMLQTTETDEDAEMDAEQRRLADADADAPLERPLPPDLLLQTRHFGGGGGQCAFVATSDLALLEDLLARTRGAAETAGTADLLVRLALASTQWTTFGFAGGFGTLTDALAAGLRQRPNVRFLTGQPVTAVTAVPAEPTNAEPAKLAVRTAAGTEQYDRVVSTLVAPALYRVTGGDDHDGSRAALPALRDAHAVTIMVVNLFYAEPGLNAPHHGFGYLIPQSVPLAENPEAALGVLFDSDREALLEGWEEEGSLADDDADTPSTGTKLTVLLGGHFWDDYTDADFPAPDQAIAMAEAVVQRHLRTTPLAGRRPQAARTKLCRHCIPQHYVGHAARLAAVDDQLARAFGGRLAVAGSSFTATGPGVLASVRAAYDVALRVAGRGYRSSRDGPGESAMLHVGDTGLARFRRPETDAIVPVRRSTLPLRFGNKTYRSPQTGTWTVHEER